MKWKRNNIIIGYFIQSWKENVSERFPYVLLLLLYLYSLQLIATDIAGPFYIDVFWIPFLKIE